MNVSMKVLSFLYNLLILAGLTWQVIEVSILYFNFGVLTHLDIQFDEIFTVPDMSVCIAFYDIMDRSKVSTVTSGGTVLQDNLNPPQKFQEFVRIQSNITIDQVYD